MEPLGSQASAPAAGMGLYGSCHGSLIPGRAGAASAESRGPACSRKGPGRWAEKAVGGQASRVQEPPRCRDHRAAGPSAPLPGPGPLGRPSRSSPGFCVPGARPGGPCADSSDPGIASSDVLLPLALRTQERRDKAHCPGPVWGGPLVALGVVPPVLTRRQEGWSEDACLPHPGEWSPRSEDVTQWDGSQGGDLREGA